MFLQKVAIKFCRNIKTYYLCTRNTETRLAKRGRTLQKAHWTLSSAGSERLPYKQRVGGSNPSAPTFIQDYLKRVVFFLLLMNFK